MEGTAGGLPARERLLAAAEELFYEEGVHSVGINRVLARAGQTCLVKLEGSS